MNLGTQMKLLRTLLDMDQRAVAARIGVSRSSYNQWERGLKPPEKYIGRLVTVLPFTPAVSAAIEALEVAVREARGE
jgi:transcriptional regulator with XRE-family HTH domain